MKIKSIWREPEERPKSYYILNNIFSAITHGIGFGLAVAGLVLLIVKSAKTGQPLRVTCFTLYGVSLVLLYLFSTLYHSLIFTRARKVFQVFDHSSIFILIAGTYMPYTLVAIGGVKGWWMLGIIWALCLFGTLFYIFNQGKHVIFDTVLYVALGWMIILAGNVLYPILGSTGFWLLVWGGIAYTVGAILFSMRGVPYIHVIWHCFVLLGSILMFFSIYLYV